jgi:hypothetical protein
VSGASGPLAGYAQRVTRGIEEASASGDMERFAERAIPSVAISNALKALRVAKEGVDRNYAGKVTIAYEPSTLEKIAAAMSFSPGERSRLYRIKDAERREGVFLQAAHERLIVPYAAAIASGDAAKRQQALDAIRAWNRDVPAKWKLPMSKVIQSVRARRKQFQIGAQTGIGTPIRQLQPALREQRQLYPGQQ